MLEEDANAPYRSDVAAVLRALGTDAKEGLDEAEAARRLRERGLNELVERGGKGPWSILWEQFTSVMVIILVVAAVVSAALGDYEDAGAIMVILVLNTVLGSSQEYRAEKAMAALKRMATPTVRVYREGSAKEISSRELVPATSYCSRQETSYQPTAD